MSTRVTLAWDSDGAVRPWRDIREENCTIGTVCSVGETVGTLGARAKEGDALTGVEGSDVRAKLGFDEGNKIG